MKTVLVFLGGIGVGLFIADQYARWKATDTVNAGLDKLHLGFAAPILDPIVAGMIG